MVTWTTLAGGQPCSAASCPAILLTADGHLFVQGRRAPDAMREALALSADEDVVELSRETLERALDCLYRAR